MKNQASYTLFSVIKTLTSPQYFRLVLIIAILMAGLLLPGTALADGVGGGSTGG